MAPLSFRCCREPVVVGATHWYCLKKLIYRLFVDWKPMNLPTKLNRSLLAGLLGSMAVIGCGSDSELNVDLEGRDLCVVSYDIRGDTAGYFELKDLGNGEIFINPDNLDLEINAEGENFRLVDKRTSESVDVPTCEVETTDSVPEDDSSTDEPTTIVDETTTTSSTSAPTTTRPMTAPPSSNARTTTAAPMTAAPTTAAPTTAVQTTPAPTTAAPTTTLPPVDVRVVWSGTNEGCPSAYPGSLILEVVVTGGTSPQVSVSLEGSTVSQAGPSYEYAGVETFWFDGFPTNLGNGSFSVRISVSDAGHATTTLSAPVVYNCP